LSAIGTINGDFQFIFRQSDGADIRLWAQTFDAFSQSWLAGTALDANAGNRVLDSGLVARVDGTALVHFVQSDGTNDRLYVTEYNPGTAAWTTPGTLVPISPAALDVVLTRTITFAGQNFPFPAVPGVGAFFTHDSDIVITYACSDDIVYASVRASSTWDTPTGVDPDLGSSGSTLIAFPVIDDSGNAIALMFSIDTSDPNAPVPHFYFNQYDAGTTSWIGRSVIASDTAYRVDDPAEGDTSFDGFEFAADQHPNSAFTGMRGSNAILFLISQVETGSGDVGLWANMLK
jgi:hypothetical protein